MKKAWLLLALLIALCPRAGRAASQTGVRLDFPPGYFAPAPKTAASRHDCPAHCVNFDEGYAWAGARKFTTEEQCRGRSRAFVEGCMNYVTERRRRHR
jgi:hypothetical protein